MPLQVIVIGVGIAGFTAAVSLCQAGHVIKIFGKSNFSTKIGVALNASLNGAAVLAALGFSFEHALVQQQARLLSVDGVILQPLNAIDLSNAARDYGYHLQSVQRADLHRELLRLATHGEQPASIYLGNAAKCIDPENGVVELADDQIYKVDVIVAADGVHSTARVHLASNPEPSESGMHAFRFLIPTSEIADIDVLAEPRSGQNPGVTIFVDTRD